MGVVTVDRLRHSGGLMLTALVNDGRGAFYYTQTYYGYPLREARRLFADHCQGHGYTVEGGY